MAKFFRLLLPIAIALGLLGGPCLSGMLCGSPKKDRGCGGCCAKQNADCCAKPSAPAHKQPPPLAAASVDLKQMVAPVLFRLCIQPESTSPSFIRCEPSIAQRALLRRVDVTCIRLI